MAARPRRPADPAVAGARRATARAPLRRRGLPALLVLVLALVGLAAAGGLTGGTRAQAADGRVDRTTRTLWVGGVRRSYLLLRPAHARAGLPLVVLLHGRGGTPAGAVAQTGLGRLADGTAVLAVPTGLHRSWDAGGGCCGWAGAKGVADVAFVAAVVADVEHRDGVDPRRVYAVGYSNGGKLAYSVVCARPGLLDAVATYGSVPLRTCTGAPVSVLLSAGTADRVLPFGGAVGSPGLHGGRRIGPPLPPVRAAVQGWVRRDGCGAGSTRRDGTVRVTSWTGCRDGTAVRLAVYDGRGHAWPGGHAVPGPQQAGTLMWDFLRLLRPAGTGRIPTG